MQCITQVLTMLNKSELIDRIIAVMKQHELNASSFAETIGVQRSSISHILSGRNKPSLELLTKIEASFEEVSFEWLLKGTENRAAISPHPPTPLEISPGNQLALPQEKRIKDAIDPPTKEHPIKIVHYYADGSFESFSKR